MYMNNHLEEFWCLLDLVSIILSSEILDRECFSTHVHCLGWQSSFYFWFFFLSARIHLHEKRHLSFRLDQLFSHHKINIFSQYTIIYHYCFQMMRRHIWCLIESPSWFCDWLPYFVNFPSGIIVCFILVNSVVQTIRI